MKDSYEYNKKNMVVLNINQIYLIDKYQNLEPENRAHLFRFSLVSVKSALFRIQCISQ